MNGYFMDTYALIEITKGNKNYEKFIDMPLSTSVLNLYELYYILLRDFNEEAAKRYFYKFKQMVIKITDESIFDASLIKNSNKKKDLSYADALGYALSQENGLKFLTGDKEFRDFENVEFVK